MADTVILLMIVAGGAVFRHDLFVSATAGSRASGLINKTANTFEFNVRDTLLIDINSTVPYTGRIVSWNVCCRGLKTPLEDGTYELVYAIYRENSSVSDRRYDRVSDILNFHTNLGETGSDGEPEEEGTESTVDDGSHCYSYVYNETTYNDSLAFLIQSGDIIGACSCVRRNPNGTCTMMDEQHQCQPMVTVVLNSRDHSLLHNMTIDAFNCGTETGDALFPSVIPSSDNNNNITTENGLDTRCSDDGAVKRSRKPVQDLECRIKNHIRGMLSLKNILMMIESRSHKGALEQLGASTVGANRSVDHDVNLITPLYLLSTVINDFGNEEVGSRISELLLSAISNVLKIIQKDIKSRADSPLTIAGSTLLRIVDTFALNNYDLSRPVTNLSDNDNIDFHVGEVSSEDDQKQKIMPTYKGEHAMRVSIPREVLNRTNAETNTRNRTRVRMASFIFRNMSRLLPNSLSDGVAQNDTAPVLRLASPVISASFQCDNCTTSNLSTPVEVTFTHSSYDTALLENDDNATTTCVFWDFEDEELQGSVLFTGQWSTEGCETSFNSTSTVCRCNHLTHFAILLSAQPLSDLPQTQVLALQITGYIGVSVSLVAMAATIIVFVFLKPLRTMRNYIHIQLCVTLGIAQIIFVAGVEPRLGEGGGVSIGCRSVAVLLHYWFLVSFMWMLMEGVVLYVVLVRVFIKFHGRYIAAFTIASYGLPLLYMGALTLPLGFVRTDHYREYHPYDYGYEQACYLSPHTSFIWSLLAPVILIFLANIGFFIMAIVIMYRHQKRQNIDDKKHEIKQWIKASISLTVVMGITWIIGFLVIEVKELFTLAYIFTIFVAFQGVFIFVIFVLLSKQVRENYAKWWKAKVAESDFLNKHFGDKSLTSGTGLNTTRGKAKGQTSDSSKVFENSSEERKLAMESYCDQKTESSLFSERVKESSTDQYSNHHRTNETSQV